MNELTKKHKRELYKAMRSMHDGICPRCASHSVSRKPTSPPGYECLCGFVLTPVEVGKIQSWVTEFHDLDEALMVFRQHVPGLEPDKYEALDNVEDWAGMP